ncbi:hypothetical protein [Leifsonia sp. Root227]|uniref:hypothetical protein n=1 Tax=Leifsonia sp. Root227 TaxID=1736496 RepID=UPI0012F8AB95|nr:hypothetical protein [Leifsonia sp. Root227]
MRESDLNHLQWIVARLASNEPVNRSDMVSLLILTRGYAPKGSMLLDLGHSVAHDERNKGQTFEYLERYARRVRIVFTHGGRLHVPLAYPVEDVIRELNLVLRDLGLAVKLDPDDIATRQVMAAGIADALDGTSFALKGATVVISTGVSEVGKHYSLQLTLRDSIDGVIKYRAGTKIGLPWLIDTKGESDGDASST